MKKKQDQSNRFLASKSLKRNRMLFLFFWLLAVLFYFFFGHKLIEAIYLKDAPEFLNSVITGQSKLSLAFYFHRADKLFLVLNLFYLLAGLPAVLLISWLKIKRMLLPAIISILLSLVAFETLIGLSFRYPALVKKLPQKLIFYIYSRTTMTLPNLEPSCGLYDPELTYTLKPGVCRFTNLEFSNELRVNSLGLRDDEESLHAPEVIVVGDSVAMGWGVEQNETLAQVIERKSGLKVLNAGLPSYGTVREMILLNRLDLSNLKYLIIQYCPNDKGENQQFFFENKLEVLSYREYSKIQKNYQRNKKYFFGKYNFCLFIGIGKGAVNKMISLLSPESKNYESTTPREEAIYCLNALIKASKEDLSKVKMILVHDIEPFIEALRIEKKLSKYPAHIKNMDVVSFNDKLGGDCFYLLDGHHTARGQELIADEILKKIK